MYNQITTIFGTLMVAWLLVACSFGNRGDATSRPVEVDQSSEGKSLIVVEEAEKEFGLSPFATYDGETSLEERIIRYPVVVRATLDRVTSEVIALSDYAEGEYAVVVKLHLEVEEYLNGSGSNVITGVWPSFMHYDSMAEAEADRESLVAKRTTPYDDLEAIFFLTDDFWIYEAAKADDTYYMDATNGFAGTLWYDTIDVRDLVNRLWLPANNVGAGASREYLLALPGSNLAGSDHATESSTSTITLAALKARIAAVNAELNKSGGTTADRRQCLTNKYRSERNYAYYKAEFGREHAHKARETHYTIESGAPAGTLIYEEWTIALSPDEKATTVWLEGNDSSLFEMADGDSLPGDNNSVILGPKGSIAYPHQLTNVRPLPSGSYSITVREQFRGAIAQLCHDAKSYEWTVEAMPSGMGSLHEFLFDPVTVGNTAGADSTNGVLGPASFTGANGATTTISSTAWEPSSASSGTVSGSVRVEIVASDLNAALDEHILDFIALDGSVSLSLDMFGATVESRATSGTGTQTHTLTWTLSSQPWAAGDMLMVRIREAPPLCRGSSVNPDVWTSPGLVGDCEVLLDAADTLAGGTIPLATQAMPVECPVPPVAVTAQDKPVKSPTPTPLAEPPPRALWAGDSSIGLKTVESDTVVRATMTSLSSEVALVSDYLHGGAYRCSPVLKFNINVSEYLLGTGSTSSVAIWVNGRTYETKAEAEYRLAEILAERDSQWDSREAIIFLLSDPAMILGPSLKPCWNVTTTLY